MQTAAPYKPRLATIQILRGAAAIAVLFRHVAEQISGYSHQVPAPIITVLSNLGGCGVDLFFVISGFIMVYTTSKVLGWKAARHFLSKRIKRIYPLYWLWTTILLAMWLSHLALRSHRYSAWDIFASYLLLPVNDQGTGGRLLFQGWTLAFEILFYIIFASAMVTYKSIPRVLATTVLMAGIYFAGHALQPGAIRGFATNSIIFEFVYGMVVGTMALKFYASLDEIKRHKIAQALVILGLCLFALVMRLGKEDAHHGRVI